MAIVFLGLGSNLGDRAQHLMEAKKEISQKIGVVVAESSVYENEAVGFAGNAFYNQVVKVETELQPENLLIKTQEIEKKMGRTQKTVSKHGKPLYENRIIDIDILLYDDITVEAETLTIPHPRMFEREFVMKPLRELVAQ